MGFEANIDGRNLGLQARTDVRVEDLEGGHIVILDKERRPVVDQVIAFEPVAESKKSVSTKKVDQKEKKK